MVGQPFHTKGSLMPPSFPRGAIATGCPTCDGFLQSFQDSVERRPGLFLPSGQRWQNPTPPRVRPQPDPTGQGKEWVRIEGYTQTAPRNAQALFGMDNPLRGGGRSTTQSGRCASCGATLTVHMDHHLGSYGYVEWRR